MGIVRLLCFVAPSIVAVAALGLTAPRAQAQMKQVVTNCQTTGGLSGNIGYGSAGYVDQNGNACTSGAIVPNPTTYQGTMTLAAATSTSLIAANVTMNNSTTLPLAGAFGNLGVVNNGSNSLIVCWFGGVCGPSAGGETLLAGAGDNKNLTGSAAAPTIYSVSGTTLSFSN